MNKKVSGQPQKFIGQPDFNTNKHLEKSGGGIFNDFFVSQIAL